MTTDDLHEGHRCALTVAHRAVEIYEAVRCWGEVDGNEPRPHVSSFQLVRLAREVVEKEPQEVEVVLAASDIFSAVRVSAIQGWRDVWHPNAHIALIKLAKIYTLDLAYIFSTDDMEEDGSVGAERIGWGESLLKGDLQQLAKLVENQRQRFFSMLHSSTPDRDVDRLSAEAQVELAKARILLLQQSAVSTVQPPPLTKESSYEAQAIGLFLEHPEWTNAAIAERLGINWSNLSRYPNFRHLRSVQAQEKESRRRGHRQFRGDPQGPDEVDGVDESDPWQNDAEEED